MRLIDADALIEDLKGSLFYSDAIPLVEDAPTAYDVDDGNADIYGAGYKLGYEDGYNLAILDKEKQITALYEDCENGAEDDVVLGWNRAIDKVREVIKAGGNNDNR